MSFAAIFMRTYYKIRSGYLIEVAETIEQAFEIADRYPGEVRVSKITWDGLRHTDEPVYTHVPGKVKEEKQVSWVEVGF